MNQLIPITYEAGNNSIRIINQNLLPNTLDYKTLLSLQDVWYAIKNLEVRGAPLIGLTAAYGLAMAACNFKSDDLGEFLQYITDAKTFLASARPTAVNLENALERMAEGLFEIKSVTEGKHALIEKATLLHQEDIAISRQIGLHGAALLRAHANVLTYCNAGLLATGNTYGTALAPIYTAREQGKDISVVACETRPVLQGARLTTFELTYNKVPTTLITDNMIGWFFTNHSIDAVFVGCDRVAKNGDFANKIGTYTLAVLAQAHHVPFYVCMPSTTIDFNATNGDGFIIENRDPDEVRSLWYREPMVASKATIFNPAFDCTPASYVKGFITEKGILQPPFIKEHF